MGFSEVFGFLKILNESIKLLPKNGKFMATIAILSLILPSILVLLFSYSYKSLINDMTNSITQSSGPDSGNNPYHYQRMLLYLAAILLVEIACLIAYIVISHLSGIATILVSAMSYTDKKLSSEDLFSTIKRKWRKQPTNRFRVSSNPSRYMSVAVMLAVFLAIFYRNPISISIAIVIGISGFVFQLYSSVVWALSHVVSVVEDSCEGKEALEKAEELVKGQRLHGFMMNLFFNLLFLIIFLGCWMILGDKGSLNLTIYGLFFVNSVSLAKIFGCTAYTVFYFQCKKHHGEEIDVLGNFQYIKLPTATQLGNDVP